MWHAVRSYGVAMAEPVAPFPVYFSVALVTHDSAITIEATLQTLIAAVSPLVSEFEIVVTDNASHDETVAVLKRLTGPGGLPNVQVFALAREVDADTATWVGLDAALGDFCVTFDPDVDAVDAFVPMLRAAAGGADVVFATNRQAPAAGWVYRVLEATFDEVYHRANGIRHRGHLPSFRLLSRAAIHFVSQHPAPSLAYRHLASVAGFERAFIEYSVSVGKPKQRRLFDAVDRGIRMLVSSTRAPMRVVTLLSTLAAALNVIYTGYVIAVYLLKDDVSPGWTTLSLQQSGMFLLLSLMILVLGEYILQMASLSNEGPRWHVAREFTSTEVSRRRALNVTDGAPTGHGPATRG